MPTDAVMVVRGAYEAFGRGDMAAVLAVMDPEIEWVESEAVGVPTRGTHIGPAAVAEGVFATVPRHWERFDLEPTDFFSDGDAVIVRGVVDAVARASGRSMRAPFVHIFTLQDGRLTRLTNHHDTALWMETLRA